MEIVMASLTRFDSGQVSRMHPNLLSKGFLGDAVFFQLGQQRLQGHTLQVCLQSVSVRTSVRCVGVTT